MFPTARLVQEIADARAVAFIGSGLSLAAGLPDWPGLLKYLIGEARARDAITELDHTEFLAWLGKPDYLMLADALVHLLAAIGWLSPWRTGSGLPTSPQTSTEF